MRKAAAPEDRVRNEALFDSSSDAIAFYGRDGRFLKINRAFEKLLGYSRRALAGRSFLDITPREFHASCKRVLGRMMRTGKPDIFDKEYRRKDGSRVPVRVAGFPLRGSSGKLLGYASIARDVTALRRAISNTEEALRGSLSLAEAALESTADGLLIVDRAGRVSGFNRRFLEMWRIPRRLADAGLDAVMLDFVLKQLKRPEAFLARVKQLYSNPIEESVDVIEFKDGRIFERYSRPQLLGQKIVGRVWSFRDVTLPRRLERALAELSGREQAKIGRELHDSVGQTFTAISLLARSGRKDMASARDAMRRIEAISRDGVKQVRMISRALLPPELQQGDLRGALRALESSARELFKLACDVAVLGPAQHAEPSFATEIYRIAQEAVHNAARHSKGTRVRVLLKHEDGRLRLTVSDDGAGFRPRAYRARGRGLGLEIMRQRAAHLGGELEIRTGRSGTTILCDCPFLRTDA